MVAAVRVMVKPVIWEWVSKQIADIDFNTNIHDKVKKWSSGISSPTFKQIEEFSRKTGIPLGYFFLNALPQEKIELLKFRTVDSEKLINPSRELKITIQDMESIQDWMRDYRQSNGDDALEWVGCINEQNTKICTSKIRKILDIRENWFENVKDSRSAFNFIRNRLSRCGVIVMMNGVMRNNTYKPLNIAEFRAFALTDKFAPLIFINSVDSDAGKLFSLLHETVHIALGRSDLFNVSEYAEITGVSDEEVFCNAVAAEILVPKEYFKNKWYLYEEKTRIAELAEVFSCSRLVIARRALDLKLIDEKEYFATLHWTKK